MASPRPQSSTSFLNFRNIVSYIYEYPVSTWVSLFLIFLITPSCVLTAPNYDTFLRTNSSRIHAPRSATHHNTYNDHPDAHRGPHRERHTKDIIQTTTGALRGVRRVFADKRELLVFYGVPFARPPLGRLRFKKPQPLDPWNGTLNAFHQPNTCQQEVPISFPDFRGEATWLPNTNISEDCLYMNIWVPRVKKHNKKMPILVWIYGGGFVSGTATLDIYNADALAIENNVIVVVPQYRVGAFGFLYMGHEDAPGNMGMYDQAMAMQWIKDNAAKFEGDPNSITVFGESAGGSSVTFHLISPVSRHLLDRGIIQSGTINAPWSIMTAARAREIADRLLLDCECVNDDGSSKSVPEAIECLRDVPAETISRLQWNSYSPILKFMSAPTIDGEFLPKDPMEMLKEGNFKKIPLLIGSNRDEGSYFILYDFIQHFNKDGPNCISPDVFKKIYNEVFETMSLPQREAIRFQYTHWEDQQDACNATRKFIDFVGDYYFICPTNKFAETYASHGADVYYYFFTQRTSSNPWGDWMGVMHADEIEYVFGLPLNNSHGHTDAEKELSKRIMKYFSAFAATGSTTPRTYAHPLNNFGTSTATPTTFTTSNLFGTRTVPVVGSSGPSTSSTFVLTSPATNEWWTPVEEGEEWPLYTKEKPNYFILNAEERGTGRGPRSHTCAFWNVFMPLIPPGTMALPGTCDKPILSGSFASGGSPVKLYWLIGTSVLIIKAATAY